MEFLQQSLSPLNWILLMSGCPLYKFTNKYTRVAVSSYACLIVFANIFIVLQYLYSGEGPSMLMSLLFKVWDASNTTLAVSTILIICSARKEFLEILNRISILLSNEDRKRLYIFSLVFFIYKLLFVLVFHGHYILYWLNKLCGSWREDWWTFFLSILHLSIQLHDWEITIICLFVIFLHAIHLAERNVMNNLNQNLENVGPKVLYKQLHKILFLKEHFVEYISFLPLFLYCYTFLFSVFCMVRLHSSMVKPSVSSEERFAIIILMTSNVVTLNHVLLLTLFTHRLSCQSRTRLKKMEYAINTKHDHLLQRNVMKLIEEAQMYEYRAAGFFVINKELLLSFFSAFVTFTVLFTQLINHSK